MDPLDVRRVCAALVLPPLLILALPVVLPLALALAVKRRLWPWRLDKWCPRCGAQLIARKVSGWDSDEAGKPTVHWIGREALCPRCGECTVEDPFAPTNDKPAVTGRTCRTGSAARTAGFGFSSGRRSGTRRSTPCADRS